MDKAKPSATASPQDENIAMQRATKGTKPKQIFGQLPKPPARKNVSKGRERTVVSKTTTGTT